MTFSAVHILATAAITGLAAAAAAWWKLRRWPEAAAVFLVSGAAVFLWRLSANMPQLNDDGLQGFSGERLGGSGPRLPGAERVRRPEETLPGGKLQPWLPGTAGRRPGPPHMRPILPLGRGGGDGRPGRAG